MIANLPSPPESPDLSPRLKAWRERPQRRGRIPAAVWAEATGLARTYGVSRVSQSLGLNDDELQQRVSADRLAGAVVPAGFVELPLSPVRSSPRECTLEVQKPSGSKLTVRLSGATSMELLPWLQTFLHPRS